MHRRMCRRMVWLSSWRCGGTRGHSVLQGAGGCHSGSGPRSCHSEACACCVPASLMLLERQLWNVWTLHAGERRGSSGDHCRREGSVESRLNRRTGEEGPAARGTVAQRRAECGVRCACSWSGGGSVRRGGRCVLLCCSAAWVSVRNPPFAIAQRCAARRLRPSSAQQTMAVSETQPCATRMQRHGWQRDSASRRSSCPIHSRSGQRGSAGREREGCARSEALWLTLSLCSGLLAAPSLCSAAALCCSAAAVLHCSVRVRESEAVPTGAHRQDGGGQAQMGDGVQGSGEQEHGGREDETEPAQQADIHSKLERLLTPLCSLCSSLCIPSSPGYLVSVDSYMNLQLASSEEWIGGKCAGNLGEILIRCNNVLYIRGVPEEEALEAAQHREGDMAMAH